MRKTMLKNARSLMALLFAIGLMMTAIPAQVAQASSEINFNKTATHVRGPIHWSAVDACANKVYTPVKDSDGNLRIIGMGLTGNAMGDLPQAGSQHVGGTVNEIDIAGLNGCNFFVTAIRTQNNSLKLISWFSSNTGFQRLGDTGNNGMLLTELDVTSMGYPGHNPDPNAGMVIVAGRSVAGAFVVASYGVVGGTFELKDVVIGEQATDISIAALPPVDPTFTNGRVIVAYRTAQDKLRLANYRVTNGGALILTSDSGNQAGEVQKVALARYASDRVITAVKASDGKLKLIPWRIHDNGSITRLTGIDDPTFNNPTAGEVSEIDVVAYNAAVPGISHHVVTAVRTTEGNLRLIAWGIDGGNIVRLGDSGNKAGAATHIRVAWSNNHQRIVTSMRDSDGNLRVIAWSALGFAQAAQPQQATQVVFLPIATR